MGAIDRVNPGMSLTPLRVSHGFMYKESALRTKAGEPIAT